MGKVLLFTDGAARGNPDGPGGYGAVLQFTDSKGQLHEKTLSAGYVRTTNNRMELMAAIAGDVYKRQGVYHIRFLSRCCGRSLFP